MKIAIIAALPGELKPLIRTWTKVHSQPSGIALWSKTRDGDELLAVCAGIGSEAARRAFTAAEAHGPLDLVLSVGWAGALTAQSKPTLLVSEVIDAQTGERFPLARNEGGLRLVTTQHVAGRDEKRRLAATYAADLVDMEAAVIARLAAMRNLPMVCFKAVSDNLDARLPDLNPFIDRAGKLRMPAFLAHVAPRPHTWASLLILGRRSKQASKQLADTIEHFLAERER